MTGGALLGRVPGWLWLSLTGASVLGLLLAALVLPRVIARLPRRWFVDAPPTFRDRLRGAPLRTLARNGSALLLLLAGVMMLFLPGQGVLTILAGLLLSDLPLRDRLARVLVRRGAVRRAVQGLRGAAGVPPFEGI